jgi:hypothetical protein
MSLFSNKHLCGFIACLLLLSVAVQGQTPAVWGSTTSAARKNAADQVAKSKKKFKDIKKHLQEWGLDSNYNHELLVGGKVNSNGWSGSFYYLIRKSYKVSNLWEVHFSEIKHDKQDKLQGTNSAFPQLGAASPFVYGKINNLYTLQVGFGKEVLLLPAVMDGNLSVSFRYSGGFSLGMLKPYYLKLIYTDSVTALPYLATQKYSGTNSERFLNTGAILGAAGFTKGLGDMIYVPGAYLEACFVILPGNSKSFIQAITLGANAAFYSRSLPVMADQKAYPYQASLFAGLAIGKRWK